MARSKPTPPPIDLLTTEDGQRVVLVAEKEGYTFRVLPAEPEDDDQPGEDDEPESVALTASEWGRVAIQLLVKCPDAKDPIGLTSATADVLHVTGKTLGRRGQWTASLTDVGSGQDGRVLLEWHSSRPLAQFEIGRVFRTIIERLSKLADEEAA
jgi:hypothetical protein